MTTTPDLPFSHPFRVAALSPRKPTRFALTPDKDARTAIAASLGLISLPEFSFKGEIRPTAGRDYVLEADLAALAVQACSVTLAPVSARLSDRTLRRYIADYTVPEGDEVEMPEDDTSEPLPDVIDVGAVAVEALALALPLYPRAPGAALGEAVFAAPGTAPLRDGDLNPFAGLAGLAKKMRDTDDGA